MKKDKTPLHLRTLCIVSFLALSLSIILPIVAKMEGEKVDTAVFAYLFAGLIGASAYETASRLHRRITTLENQAAGQKNDTKRGIKEQQ